MLLLWQTLPVIKIPTLKKDRKEVIIKCGLSLYLFVNINSFCLIIFL